MCDVQSVNLYNIGEKIVFLYLVGSGYIIGTFCALISPNAHPPCNQTVGSP